MCNLTCDLPFSHATPESLGFSHRPVLHFGAEATEELVFLEVRHPSAVPVPGVVDATGTSRGGRSTLLGRHLPVYFVKLLRCSRFRLQLHRAHLRDLLALISGSDLELQLTIEAANPCIRDFSTSEL